MIPIRPKNEIVEQYKKDVICYILKKRGGKKKLALINENLKKVKDDLTLDKLLAMDCDELENLKNDYKKYKRTKVILSIKNRGCYTFTIFRTYYEDFFSKSNGAKFISNLGVAVCPYCNRNYIYNATKERTAQIDHFISQAEYPIFALSFYNLVPCCPSCNKFKSDEETKIINPYDKRLNTDTFKFYAMQKSVNHFDLVINSQNKPALKDMNDVLKLKDLYLHHSYLADELYQKHLVLSDDYIDSLRKEFFEKLCAVTSNDFMRFLLGNYGSDADFLKRSLSKATKDIAIQFELL